MSSAFRTRTIPDARGGPSAPPRPELGQRGTAPSLYTTKHRASSTSTAGSVAPGADTTFGIFPIRDVPVTSTADRPLIAHGVVLWPGDGPAGRHDVPERVPRRLEITGLRVALLRPPGVVELLPAQRGVVMDSDTT